MASLLARKPYVNQSGPKIWTRLMLDLGSVDSDTYWKQYVSKELKHYVSDKLVHANLQDRVKTLGSIGNVLDSLGEDFYNGVSVGVITLSRRLMLTTRETPSKETANIITRFAIMEILHEQMEHTRDNSDS